MLKVAFIFSFLAAILMVNSQSINIISFESQPISDVFVFNKNGSINVFTDHNGSFDLSLFKNTDTLYFQHPGYHLIGKPRSYFMENSQLQLERKVHHIVNVLANQNSSFKNEITGISAQTQVIDRAQIQKSNAQTTADLLQESGVFVQKSQMGGGSPILRGFEANKVLLVVDNVRLNNAIYRGGHIHNSIMIDPFLLEKSEIIYGPGASIYGSDAIGGVIHFHSIKPTLSSANKKNIKATFVNRNASANREQSNHFDVNIANQNIAALTSFSIMNFGNLKAGKNIRSRYPNYGTLDYIYFDNQGEDQTIQNPDPFNQIGTSFDIYHLAQKFRVKLSKNYTLDLNAQHSFTSPTPRFDRLNDIKDNQMVFATWNYSPQSRSLQQIELNGYKPTLVYDYFSFGMAHQFIKEGRQTRRFNNEYERINTESLNVLSTNIDFNKTTANHKNEFFYGAEWVFNNVNSQAKATNINSLSTISAATRYPDGGSTMQTAGIYFVWQRQLNNQLSLQSSIRQNYNLLNAYFNDTTFYPLPYSSIHLINKATTGGFALLYDTKNIKHKLNFSSAFRAPNIDDVAKVFDSQPGLVVIPNNELKPENVYNLELNSNYYKNDAAYLGWTNYISMINNFIQRDIDQFNEKDSIVYDGVLSQVISQQNVGKGIVYGSSLSFKLILNKALSFNSSLNYTKGINTIDQTPLAHIPPLYGKSQISYQLKKHNFDFWTIYNGPKEISQYSSDPADRLVEATVDGTPSWFTLNAKYIYSHNQSFELILGIDNILDLNYKPFSSGPFAAGRNLVFSTRFKL